MKDAEINYLQTILNAISQGLLYIDANGTVLTYNKAAEAIFGLSKEQVLVRSFWNNFSDNVFGFSMRNALEEQEGPKMTTAVFPGSPGSSEPRYLEIDISYVNKSHKSAALSEEPLEGIILLIRDISDSRRLQSMASRNDRMTELGEMAAMVAHEVRNPLGGIKGFASLLKRDLAEQPDLQKLASYIVEGTDSLNRLVNDVLDYSRPLKLHKLSSDVLRLMQELLLHMNADESIDPRIELHCYSTKESIIANIDAATIKSLILNLASNAFKAMPEGGELRIDVDANTKDVIIKVSDTGQGITPENLKKIFSPFFTTRSEGHGLGLTEVAKIIRAHDGEIHVESTPGKGTTFTIRLPL